MAATSPTPSPAVTAKTTSRGGWFGIFGDPEERAARRAYRRSLPPLYRWRRVLLGLLTLLLVVVLGYVIADGPVSLAKQGWYALTGTTRAIGDVTATPEGRRVDERHPASDAVDDDPSTYWAREWVVGTDDAEACNQALNAGGLELSWETPRRVRALHVHAGLRAEADNRLRQHRPATLLVSFRAEGDSSRSCETLVLDDKPDRQVVDLDTRNPVDSLTIAVGSVHLSKTDPQANGLVALRELEVHARPE